MEGEGIEKGESSEALSAYISEAEVRGSASAFTEDDQKNFEQRRREFAEVVAGKFKEDPAAGIELLLRAVESQVFPISSHLEVRRRAGR